MLALGRLQEALALVAAMDGRRGHRTARAARGRCPRRELELHGCLLNGHLREAYDAARWESSGDKRMEFMSHNLS